jgi:hypothetical protein
MPRKTPAPSPLALFAAAVAGTVQTGRFEGKMIVVASLLDREALPWQADCVSHQGARAPRERNRRPLPALFTDNALHGDDEIQEHPTHTSATSVCCTKHSAT